MNLHHPDKVLRYRVEKWFWAVQAPISLGIAVWYRWLWEIISIPYVAFLSIYALVLTLSGAEQAAKAAGGAARNRSR